MSKLIRVTLCIVLGHVAYNGIESNNIGIINISINKVSSG